MEKDELVRVTGQLSELRRRLLADGQDDVAKHVQLAFKSLRTAGRLLEVRRLQETSQGDLDQPGIRGGAPQEPPPHRDLHSVEGEHPDLAANQQAPAKARRAARRDSKRRPPPEGGVKPVGRNRGRGIESAQPIESSLPERLGILVERWKLDVRRELLSLRGRSSDRGFASVISERAKDLAQDHRERSFIEEGEADAMRRWLMRIASRLESHTRSDSGLHPQAQSNRTDDEEGLLAGSRVLARAVDEMRHGRAC